MDSSSDDRLFAVLESLRPAPSPVFAAELDERAAAGFPPRVHPASAPFARLAAWFRGLSPRLLVLGGGATALAVIAIATVVVAGSSTGNSLHGDFTSATSASEASGDTARGDAATAAPTQPDWSGATFEAETPTATAKPVAPAGSASAGGESASESSSTEGAGAAYENGIDTREASKPGTGPYASGASHRDVERAAEMTLGTEPGEVGDAAGKVLEAVHQLDGIVLSSSVRGGSEGDAGARFDLLIPSAKLGDALAAFSAVAEVRSRHEASNDITAPTNTVGEGLQDSQARIDGLLNQLADSETESEREAVEALLRTERRHAATLKAQLTDLRRRANLSRVSLRIETDASNAPSGSGGWDVGDAFHDAGRILAVAAGVAIVGLAILGPIALIALLAWLANRAWTRRARERALAP